MKNTNWQVINECHDSNICWKFFKDILTRCINTHAPMTKKTVKGKPIPWLTEEIKKQMNDRDGLLRKARKSKNTEHWKNYKAMKNRTNNSINRAKEKYHKELLNENISKPEKFWKHIKALFPTKSPSQCPKSFVIDSHQTTNESEIANCFCSFFHTAVKNLKVNSIKLKDFVWSLPKKLPIKTAHRFNFRYVSVPEVTRMLKEVNSKKSAGPIKYQLA